MASFPDESTMERSEDGSEPIRGGSVGLNRILGRFVTRANSDRNPEYTAALLSAFCIIRNILAKNQDLTDQELEEAFLRDVTLFLEYYDIYLSFTKNSMGQGKRCPVIVYFPDYRQVEASIRREMTGRRADLFTRYARFVKRYDGRDGLVKQGEHLSCFWIRAGDATYPHKEVARKFRDLASGGLSYYAPGDKIALMSNVLLDFHIGGRLRGIHSLESFTGELKAPDQFRFRLDKEGRLPFNTTTHVVFGDSVMIKPWVTPKVRRQLLDMAEKEKWLTRGEEDIRARISKTSDIPLRDLRKFDFI